MITTGQRKILLSYGRDRYVSYCTVRLITKSIICEGEFVTLSDMMSNAAHEKNKLSTMNDGSIKPGLIMEDNAAAIMEDTT